MNQKSKDYLSTISSYIQISSIVPAILFGSSDATFTALVFFPCLIIIILGLKLNKITPYTVIILFSFPAAFSIIAIAWSNAWDKSEWASSLYSAVLFLIIVMFTLSLTPCSDFYKEKANKDIYDKHKLLGVNIFFISTIGVFLVFIICAAVAAYITFNNYRVFYTPSIMLTASLMLILGVNIITWEKSVTFFLDKFGTISRKVDSFFGMEDENV